ncbi:MAG: LuxR family transcriptional regulator [Firmicutes bacterium]|nr:LuxR family transcriptional regulator [Bacillota bacterium]
MLYKSVFFGYIAAAVAVVAALVLILLMRYQDRQYERGKLIPLTGALVGSVCMNTMYFLSFFGSLTSLTSRYQPVERGLDILSSFVINLFLFLFFYHAAKESDRSSGAAEKLYRPALAVLIAGFAFAGIVYVGFVTDEYRVASGHLVLAETGQIVLTAVICLVTAVYGWLAFRSGCGPVRQIAALAGINVITAIYNCAGSIVLFRNHSSYLNWSGPRDLNTWLFVLSDILLLLIAVWYFRRQADAPAFAEGDAPAFASADVPAIPASLGLTPRETEIAQRILRRQTCREIAEELTISEHTVKRHVHNIYEKAGVSRRDELIRMLKDQD